jgi:protein-S-isoprenylcysteine O-methyltransferase Ste14
MMAPVIGLLYGVGVYAFFLATFLYAIAFVGNLPSLKTIDGGTAGARGEALLVNVLLLALFAGQHTVMARPGFKRWWTTLVPPSVERSTFVLLASLALALLMWQWRPLPDPVWTVDDPIGRWVLLVIFGLGWLLVLIATFQIGHFKLFGLQQVFDGFRDKTPARSAFRTPLLYNVVRHPIHLGFILAFWSTPTMTEGHVLFAIATTAYILIGIVFEERDLLAQFGDEYRRYRTRIPMILPFLRGRRDDAARRSPTK